MKSHKIIKLGFVAILVLAVTGIWWLSTEPPSRAVSIRLISASKSARHDPRATNIQPIRAIPDGLRLTNDSNAGAFYLTSDQDISLFVTATGVQVPSGTGWKTIEEYRGEIWRLKAGVPYEVCVERPQYYGWRAFIRYGVPMTGLPLLKANLREAWLIKSFSNWNGKPWGGGKWGGAFEAVSVEVEQ